VFGPTRIAVYIDGCFWHGCPTHATMPKANRDWWQQKLEANQTRDQRTTETLTAHGWLVLRFWEHEDPETVAASIEGAVRARRIELSGGG
jgi:DNA mismatch endonuclease (patch repair protein)